MEKTGHERDQQYLDYKFNQDLLDMTKSKQVVQEQPKKEQSDEGTHRLFTRAEKQICWNRSAKINGRDPERWRLDPVGNPVLNALRGCHGALCHEYDHIVPFSKGGKTVVENC